MATPKINGEIVTPELFNSRGIHPTVYPAVVNGLAAYCEKRGYTALTPAFITASGNIRAYVQTATGIRRVWYALNWRLA